MSDGLPHMDVPEAHWRNVGRVCVHAAWLEEAGALIVNASEGHWDMTYDHLRHANSKQGLLHTLRGIADQVGKVVSTSQEPTTGERRTETGKVAQRLRDFTKEMEKLLDERDRIIHSVPWLDWFSGGDVYSIHPRSMTTNPSRAKQGLPSTEECEELVEALIDLAREGQHTIAPRVGALLNPEGARG